MWVRVFPSARISNTLVEKAYTVIDRVAGGWTYFYPFNPSKGGIDPAKIWKDDADENEPDIDEAAKTYVSFEILFNLHRVPVFAGTPRSLVIVAPLLQGALVGYPGLAVIPGSSLNYRFIARPDVRNACHTWNMNCWISPGDDMPGLDRFTARDLVPKQTTTATLSNVSLFACLNAQLRLRIAPSIHDYEKRLLDKVALTHFEAFPSSMISDDKGALILPTIEERRIHIGFHNGRTFLGPTVLTNAVPKINESGHGTDLVFHGQIDLENYIQGEPGIALVFVVEYKVKLTVRAPIEKKTGLSAFMESLSPTSAAKAPVEKAFVEKLVCCGWSAWNVSNQYIGKLLQDATLTIGLEEEIVASVIHSTSTNPFHVLVYAPSKELANDAATEQSGVLKDEQTLSLHFRFHDELYPPISSIRGMIFFDRLMQSRITRRHVFANPRSQTVG